MSYATHAAIPSQSESADTLGVGADYYFSILVESIRVNASGVVIARLAGDSAPRAYDVVAGEILPGRWVAIHWSYGLDTTTVAGSAIVGYAYSTADLP